MAQTTVDYARGQSVSPAFEGWFQNEDGSFTLHFGYMNSNWEEQLHVPIGADNSIEPGGPDQGQPTNFYPRRNPYLFSIRVPKDFGDQQVIWTLTTHGKTERAYASLKADYALNRQTMSLEVGGDMGRPSDAIEKNLAPDLTVDGPKARTVSVGEALSLVAIAGDPDNLPERADGLPQPGLKIKADKGVGYEKYGSQKPVIDPYRPPGGNAFIAAGSGLRLSWIVYRGLSKHVSFEPEQMETWVDTRPWSNSPWSPPSYAIPVPPPDGRWATKVTFRHPGTYVLRAVASDSALFTHENVTVTVRP